MIQPNSQSIVGWREWIGLPKLGIPLLKAKIDTGARTSALHTFALENFSRNGADWVRFFLHPIQMRTSIVVQAETPIVDRRWVTDSGGHQEYRYVISTPISIRGKEYPIEITLTTRDTMRFRMLVGRTALAGRFFVDAEQSYASGQHSKSSVLKLYRSMQSKESLPS